MGITSLTSRDLNQDVSKAKKAAEAGPVVITDRGKPSHVLMTYAEFERLTGRRGNLLDALSMPRLSDTELEPARVVISAREIDLS